MALDFFEFSSFAQPWKVSAPSKCGIRPRPLRRQKEQSDVRKFAASEKVAGSDLKFRCPIHTIENRCADRLVQNEKIETVVTGQKCRGTELADKPTFGPDFFAK
jgi:hypothetical protein